MNRLVGMLKIIGVMCLSCFFLLGNRVEANENLSARGISIEPVLPANQKKDVSDYFSLKLAPEKKQTVTIRVSNTTAESKRFMVRFNQATTNENGLISYSVVKTEDTGMRDCVKVQDKIEVAAGETKELPVAISMPKTPFNGVSLGGIQLIPLDEPETSETANTGEQKANLSSQVTYTIALEIFQTDEPVQEAIDYKSAGLTFSQGKVVVGIDLENTQNKLMTDIVYDVEIYDVDKKNVMAKETYSGYRFAPDSRFLLTVPWEETTKAGTYHVVLDAVSKESKKSWHWEESFEITDEEYSKNVPPKIKQTGTLVYWGLVSLFVVVLVIVLVVYLYGVKRSKRKAEKGCF